MPRKRLLLWLAMALPALLGVSGDCDSCTPTTTTATVADKIDLTAASRSSTLEARLTVTESNEPLGGKTIRFAVFDDGAEVFSDTATTGKDGFARFDLKRVRVDTLEAIARGDEFRASFAGDSTYCSSYGDAAFRVLKAPAGITVESP